jgi:hypothetical protein
MPLWVENKPPHDGMSPTTPPFESCENTLKKLESYLVQGYLLHGSKMPYNTLLPRQAHDTTNRQVGTLLGVYAESDDVRIPILMSLFAPREGWEHDWKSSYSGNLEKLTVTGEHCTFTPGYVHVVPRETFVRQGDKADYEWVSPTPVTPIAILPITPDILPLLSGLHIEISL